MEQRLGFSMALLSNPADAPRPIAGCANGHLIVAGNSCWAPESFSTNLATLTCRLVEDCNADAPRRPPTEST